MNRSIRTSRPQDGNFVPAGQEGAEIDALLAEVDALGRKIAAIERLLRFVHGDG